jgi:hypothetical protein
MYYEKQLKSLIIKIILKNYQIFESNFIFHPFLLLFLSKIITKLYIKKVRHRMILSKEISQQFVKYI